jgi:hypothetical protein
MPVYKNPDFRHLPAGLATIFSRARKDSFFAQPDWYDLMAQFGIAPGSEIRVYTDERPGSMVALLLMAVPDGRYRHLASLTNAYSVEHGLVYEVGSNLDIGLRAIVAEIVADRPRWERLTVAELDPGDRAYVALVRALRWSGLLVECVFHSGCWFQETAALEFTQYLSSIPSSLFNTWRRKERKVRLGGQLRKAFFSNSEGIEGAIRDYQIVYAASWKPQEQFVSFIPELMRLSARTGALRLGIYYVDDTPAAAQFWIIWCGRAVIYKLAHDQRFDDLSLGTLLTMEMVERALEGDRPFEVNLGRGDDGYKKLWLPKRRERWGIVAANPRTRRGFQFGLQREAAKVYHRVTGEPIFPPGIARRAAEKEGR